MFNIITTEKIPIKLWGDTLELDEGTFKQVRNMANLPFAYKHITLLPDFHLGYGVPIGSVLATKNVVLPNSVGVDIGCGCCSVRTNIVDISKQNLKEIMRKVREVVPLGFNKHKEPQDGMVECDNLPIVNREYANASLQVGTLGGGNHFIEIQRGDGNIWVMIHSGSRNIGKQVADHYNKVAIALNERWYSNVPKSDQLAFLPTDTPEAQMYLREMEWCLGFAYANRKVMMDRVLQVIGEVCPDMMVHEEMINIHHNYVAKESHFGNNVWVHRKGATRAREGEQGLIPGSQGTKSYVVRGRGNRESFMSCSHGAGRKMGRKAAQRDLDLKQQIELLEKKGVVHSVRTKKDLDEAPGAYKDIEDVMANQTDLINVEVALTPLAVLKG